MCHLFVEKLGILWAVRINLDDLYTTVPVCLSWCWGVERRLKECFRSVIQTARNGECLCHSLVTEGRVMDLRNIPSTFEACEQDRRVLVLRQKRSRWFCHFRIARMFTPSIFFFIYYSGRFFFFFSSTTTDGFSRDLLFGVTILYVCVDGGRKLQSAVTVAEPCYKELKKVQLIPKEGIEVKWRQECAECHD